MKYDFESVEDRCIRTADYLARTGATVRQTAKVFGISKSTVHKDVTERLWRIDRALYERAGEVLKKNKSERHLRGGEATRIKYIRAQNKKGEEGAKKYKAKRKKLP